MIPDNYSLWEAHEVEKDRWLAKRPVCEDCQEPIQEDSAYYINGCWICEDCMDSYRLDVPAD